MRRAAALVLALVYLLQAAWVLQGGADLLFPRTRIVKAGESACCTSGCGCPADARDRKACCCYPEKQEAPSVADVQVPVSSIEEARCKGLRDAASELLTLPALPGPAADLPPLDLQMHFEAVLLPPENALPAESPDKVPI